MTTASGDKDRAVLPRWRAFSTTTALGDLDSSGPELPGQADEDLELNTYRERWHSTRSPEDAAELVGAGLVLRKHGGVSDVAAWLIGQGTFSTPVQLRIARAALAATSGATENASLGLDDRPSTTPQLSATLRLPIQRLKKRVRQEPRNAVAWTELALAYTIAGSANHALASMRSALALAGDNRYVIRSAARLYMHLGAPDHAHYVLLSTPRLKMDPWLSSAELAVADIGQFSPRSLRDGRQMLAAANHPQRHVSELASAIATLEMKGGNSSKARRLFRVALEAPTENSIAQAEWAGPRLGIHFDPAPSTPDAALAFEARAIHATAEGIWDAAIANARGWQYDEPYSTAPAVAGSYAASTVGANDTALAFCEAGRVANPADPQLLNNLAYSLLELGRVQEAAAALARVDQSRVRRESAAALMATRGLLAYRQGDRRSGRHLYEAAIDLARSGGYQNVEALAALMLLREELSATVPDTSLRSLADRLSAVSRDPAVLEWRKRVLGPSH